MTNISDFIDVRTGEQLPIGSTVTRVRANANGNKPSGVLVGTAPDNMALIRFQMNGKSFNDRPTSPGSFGLKYVKWVGGSDDES